MSIEISRKGNQDYAYFYPGRGGKIYLGNVTDRKNPQARADKVLVSLDYVRERFSHYSEIEDKLVSFLSQEKRDQYLAKRVDELYRMEDRHLSLMSGPASKKYRKKA